MKPLKPPSGHVGTAAAGVWGVLAPPRQGLPHLMLAHIGPAVMPSFPDISLLSSGGDRVTGSVVQLGYSCIWAGHGQHHERRHPVFRLPLVHRA